MSATTEIERARDNNWLPLFQTAAANADLPLAYLLAIASRETNMRNILGDHENGGGLVQIDIHNHEIALQAKADGSWRTNPGKLINYGAKLLKGNYDWARNKWPEFGGENGRGWLKIATSAYNAGRGGASSGIARGDSDRRTTGHDYGRDVLNHMNDFAALLP